MSVTLGGQIKYLDSKLQVAKINANPQTLFFATNWDTEFGDIIELNFMLENSTNSYEDLVTNLVEIENICPVCVQ